MSATSKEPDLSGKRRSLKRRVKGNKFVTKSGKTIKLNRTLSEKSKARKDAKALRKAERLKDMPKGRLKRILFRLHPKRLAKYWFSRDGLYMALKLTGIGFAVGFIFLAGLFAYFRKDLPNLRDISGNNIGGSIQYYDRTGSTLLWEDYDKVKRVPVESEKIADYLKQATVAIEDRDFYNHNGFNVKGISRAAWNNAFGGSTQGGSTITQQLVKLTTEGFSTDKTITRKIKELILAVEFERSYTKDEILTGYLNAAPYGPIEYGAEIAAQTYFAKSAKDLTLDEAALLASIPKSPPVYSPYGPYYDHDELLARQHYVLDVMAEMGYITAEQRDTAKAIDTVATVHERQPTKFTGIIAPYFVMAAKSELETRLSESTYNRGGWKVNTTVDLNLQKIAEEEVANGMKQVIRQSGDTAAFVAEDVETGQVVAMVGGADFNDESRAGQFNFAQRPLPPGSSFKPYDYISLIDNTENAGAGSVMYDAQGPLEGYPCTVKTLGINKGGNCLQDYDFKYPGPLTLRYSLGGSRNVPAVKAMLAVGVDKTIEVANKLGLQNEQGGDGYKCYEPGKDKTPENESTCYASSAIGDGAYLHLDRHVHSYATISRNGNKIPQTFIMEVFDSKGKSISSLKWQPSAGEQVVRPEAAYIVADMMADPNASYMSRKSHRYKGWNFSLKTGTTNDGKDGWLMGFSTKYAAGVWVGHHTSNPYCASSRREGMCGFMETMTQPIWTNFMQRAHESLTPVERVRPAGIQTLPAYVIGTRPNMNGAAVFPSPSTDLFPSWYKRPAGGNPNEKIKKDKVSEKIATECTPPLAIEEVSDGNAAQYSSDPFYSSSTNTTDQDDIHKCDDIKPSVSIASYDNGNGSYTFDVTVGAGTHAIGSDKFLGKLNVSIDGSVIPDGAIDISAPGTYQFSYTSSLSTTATVTAYVSDSALYEAQDSIDVDFEVAPTTYMDSLRTLSLTRTRTATTTV
ncbi:penicillin-binding protein [Candidatus Saccharibacteria bacterium]|nr:penicillin-binding protein [Candidatus Saccharibacteria bacterium]